MARGECLEHLRALCAWQPARLPDHAKGWGEQATRLCFLKLPYAGTEEKDCQGSLAEQLTTFLAHWGCSVPDPYPFSLNEASLAVKGLESGQTLF